MKDLDVLIQDIKDDAVRRLALHDQFGGERKRVAIPETKPRLRLYWDYAILHSREELQVYLDDGWYFEWFEPYPGTSGYYHAFRLRKWDEVCES